MSAAVCRKRTVLDEEVGSLSLTKRGRYNSSALFPHPEIGAAHDVPLFLSAGYIDGQSDPVIQLRALFPGVDDSVLHSAYVTSDNNIHAAVHRIAEHMREENSNQQISGEQWVELVVKQILECSDMEEAKAKASGILEAFGKALKQNNDSSVADVRKYEKEFSALREQIGKLTEENGILRRAVNISNSKLTEQEERGKEVEKLKHMLGQYQDQIKSLEMANYTLSVHLRTAQQGSSFGHDFPPDVY